MIEKITSSQQAIDMENKYGAHNYSPLPVVLSKGEGAFVWMWKEKIFRFSFCLFSS